ncbi:glycosyltransferase family 4 protein [Castellaniella sp.]|uniref:glycosyltransferase family 4 protein n=1 Tax=Castellaniella sp. TaxID=1955812 RepID=UPI00355FA926
MRILHLNLEKGWRGGERQTLLTLQGLQARGHTVQLAARAASPLAGRAQAAGVAVLACSGVGALLRLLLRQRQAFDIVHAQTAQTMSLLALLRPVLRAQTVFTRRTAFQVTGTQRRHRWKWSRVDALVAISQAAAQAPRALALPVSIIPSAVEPLPVDPVRVQVLRGRFGLDGRQVLVTAAALSPEKDPCTLIEAVGLLRRTHPQLICLHFGAEGAAAAAARERIQRLGLGAHYVLAGFEARMGDALALAHVYASSSRFEALGSSVLDACLAGLPVVATEVGGHVETLAPDRGLLVPAGDAPQLARRLAWVLEHPAAAQAMAQRAQAYVARVHGVPEMVSGYEEIYQRLVLRAGG